MSDIKPGDMVQVWDWHINQSVAHRTTRLDLHGKLGYVIKDQTKGNPPGLLWEIITFEDDTPSKHIINSDWLVKINSVEDIKGRTK